MHPAQDPTSSTSWKAPRTLPLAPVGGRRRHGVVLAVPPLPTFDPVSESLRPLGDAEEPCAIAGGELAPGSESPSSDRVAKPESDSESLSTGRDRTGDTSRS